MTRAENLVIEAARQTVAEIARQLETGDNAPQELEARLKALALAVRALERGEQKDSG